jgi:hypothetical protein
VIWDGILWVLLAADAPIMFPIIWGLFELLIMWGVADKWTGTTRVIVDSQGIAIRHTTLGLGGTKRMSCSEVSEVRVELAHQNTQQAGSRANYKVKIVDIAGTKVSAARSIKGKPVAREFVRRLKKAIASRGGPDFRNVSGRI